MKRDVITSQYYPDKVLVDEFMNIINDSKSQENFIKNMKILFNNVVLYPEEWADYYIKWLELRQGE